MRHVTLHDLPEQRHIELHHPVDTPFWCHLLGVTEAQLVSAVESVGHDAGDVLAHLEGLRAAAAAENAPA